MKNETTYVFDVPDEAMHYIISRYLLKRHTAGVPITLGISQDAVEAVLKLFFQWAAEYNHIEDGKLVLGSIEEE